MTYRPITQDEIPIVAEIQARAFCRDVDRYTERYRQGGRVDWRNLRLLENEAGQPVAALTAFERDISLNGGDLAAGLVGSVAVPPDQRRRGYAGHLMTGLLEELYENQTPISLLFPFSVAYYRRLGYGLINLNWFLDLPPHHLPDYPERLDVRRATLDDQIAMRACYEQARRQPQHNGWLTRTDWDWHDRVWTEDREAVVYPAAGEIQGYLLYTLDWEMDHRPVKVVEWVSSGNAAWRGLVGFLSSLGEQATVVTYNAPRNSPLLLALNEPYSAAGGSVEFVYRQSARLVCGLVLRLVHLPAALRARRYPPAVQADLVLRVDDPQLPANGQPLRLHVADGAASVAPVQGLFAGEPPVNVETDIATFSQLYAGFVCAEQARVLGRLRADDATCALLTSVLAAAPLYLHQPDWF